MRCCDQTEVADRSRLKKRMPLFFIIKKGCESTRFYSNTVPASSSATWPKSNYLHVIRSDFMSVAKVFLSTGSNIGNRQQHLQEAAAACERRFGEIVKMSAVYETEAWGRTDQQAFLNQVLQIATALKPEDLLREILDIEKMMGRERNERWGPRIIDIDILFYDDLIIHQQGLHIPHPQMENRRFVLIPLAEIAGEFVHPVSKEPVSRLLENCTDNSQVNPLVVNI